MPHDTITLDGKSFEISNKKAKKPYKGPTGAHSKLHRNYKKEVPVTAKEAADKNKTRLDTLDKKIQGNIQKSFQILNVPPYTATFSWATNRPFLFALQDFYTIESLRGTTNGGAGSVYYPTYPALTPGETLPRVVARWNEHTPGSGANLLDKYKMWQDVKNAKPSQFSYTPVYTKYTITVKRAVVTPEQPDTWIRLDFVKSKRFFIPNTGIDSKIYSLPAALGSLGNLAVNDDATKKNAINPALFHKFKKTRWIKFPRVSQPAQNQLKTIIVHHKFKQKELKINMNIDSTQGKGEEFWQCLDPHNTEYMILSLSNNAVNQQNSQPTLQITRHCTWRANNTQTSM